jgi:CBS domain containing-hemolysin-like protein
VIDRLEKIPHPGDQILAGSYRLTVKDSSKRKIQSLIVRKREDTEIKKKVIS